ncbi:hypothetical protein [Streptomyces sp. NPDC007264]|uniref:hypothetical protein n=1 Tax=Streptomyces sp. NPDC007264 TaxID=3364777 RepID=UPI0036D8411F
MTTTTPVTAPEANLVDLDKAIAATPDAVRVALQKAVPDRFTPELAAQISADVIAQLNAMRTPTCQAAIPERPACPDGFTWCGEPAADHGVDRRHAGAAHAMRGTYTRPDGGLMEFQVVQWGDDEPKLLFQADGTWPDLNLAQTDELVADTTTHLIRLKATRRRLALLLGGDTVPAVEVTDEEISAAAFALVLDALDTAVGKSSSKAGVWQALRTVVDMYAAETQPAAEETHPDLCLQCEHNWHGTKRCTGGSISTITGCRCAAGVRQDGAQA